MSSRREGGVGRRLMLAGLLLVAAERMAEAETTGWESAAAGVATAFLNVLGAAMSKEMGKGGPTEAITVCADLAPEIAGRLSREHGWKVTRVGTRVRNPLLGIPDAWEQQVLADFAKRAAGGEAFEVMSRSELVSEPEGTYFRYMRPIVVQPTCLLCHGAIESIPAPVLEVLKIQYPYDAATGYKAGELRGAVSIKQPLGEAAW